ncbi:MAG: GerAB/ArcD/ProY family transporter [Lachnospiraceae bacterium]|nr:GerAB/ArcD/ProY family transporter [Lachnospiraceae bacterium]
MRLYNGKISERQSFRIGLLENITLGIVVIPYICANAAGRWHFAAFITGLIFTFIYSFIIYFFSKAFPEGMIEEMDYTLGNAGRIFDILYSVRYIIKASLILLYFSAIIREYMLRSFNLWTILVPFAIICGYGASRDIEKRGRLLELLFWWMLVPLIFVAVFSISNVNWHITRIDAPSDIRGIVWGGYEMLVVMSSVELMLFTLTKQKKNNWRSALKIIIWILIAVLFSYIFVQGIIGDRWAGSDSMSTLYAMQTAKFPSGIERFDYAVMAFWIIGVFAIVSGFMFYAKEFIRVCFSKRWNAYENDSAIEIISDKWWIIILVIAMVIGFSWCWSLKEVSDMLYYYLLCFDVALSLIMPSIVFICKKIKHGKVKTYEIPHKINIKSKSVISIFAVCIGLNFVLCGCEKSVMYKSLDERPASLETMDYAVTLMVKCKDIYIFDFEIADLTDYKGDSERVLMTEDFTCEAVSLDEALDIYFEENKQHINLGHLKLIRIDGVDDSASFEAIVLELKSIPYVTKTVEVEYKYEKSKYNTDLLSLIKKVYTGEEL